MLQKVHELSKLINHWAAALGEYPNAVVTFLSRVLDRSGKVLSFGIIAFGMWMMTVAFYGQIRTVSGLLKLEHPTTAQQEQIRIAYKDAIGSIGVILGILVGAIPVIISIGMMRKDAMQNGTITTNAVSVNTNQSTNQTTVGTTATVTTIEPTSDSADQIRYTP